MKSKVLHITTSLGNGGAQAVLYNLIKRSPNIDHQVVSLMGLGKYGEQLKELNVSVHTLDNINGRFSIVGLRRLIKIVGQTKPDVVQTWMYHADLAGGIAARIAGIKNIYWGVHNTRMEPTRASKLTLFIIRILSMLSGIVPKRIVVCSQRALEQHAEMGYAKDKLLFVPNGYDLNLFRPGASYSLSQIIGDDYIQFLNSRDPAVVFGFVGRWSEQKDHLNLVKACGLLIKQDVNNFICVLIGQDVDNANVALINEIKNQQAENNIYLAGVRTDIPDVMKSIDLHVLPSAFGEAYPNVVAEAMSSGTPCIVTDVGDSGLMVEDAGWVVPPSDPGLLAQAMTKALVECGSEVWKERQEKCRTIALRKFDIDQMIIRYNNAWNLESIE